MYILCAFIKSLMGRFYFKYTGHSQLHVRHDGIQMHFVLSFLWNIFIRHLLSTMEISNQDNAFGENCYVKYDVRHWAFACNLQGYLLFVIISTYCTNIKLVFHACRSRLVSEINGISCSFTTTMNIFMFASLFNAYLYLLMDWYMLDI